MASNTRGIFKLTILRGQAPLLKQPDVSSVKNGSNIYTFYQSRGGMPTWLWGVSKAH